MSDQLPEVFWEIHRGLPREGPGDNASTRRAFLMLKELPKNPRILDIGCGTGGALRDFIKNGAKPKYL